MLSRRIWLLVALELLSAAYVAVSMVQVAMGVAPFLGRWQWWALGAFIVFCVLVGSHIYHLYRRLAPKLDILSGSGGAFIHSYPCPSPLWLESPPTCVTFRILVKNRSEAQTVHNVKVRLLNAEPPLEFTPICLHWMNDNTKPYKLAFDLHPGPGEYVDVFACREDPECDELWFQVAPEGIRGEVPKAGYELTIEAKGQDTPECTKVFVIDLDTQGKVTFQPKRRK